MRYDEKAELPGNWSHRRERLHGFSLSEERVHAGNNHNTVNQLCSNKSFKKKKEIVAEIF